SASRTSMINATYRTAPRCLAAATGASRRRWSVMSVAIEPVPKGHRGLVGGAVPTVGGHRVDDSGRTELIAFHRFRRSRPVRASSQQAEPDAADSAAGVGGTGGGPVGHVGC